MNTYQHIAYMARTSGFPVPLKRRNAIELFFPNGESMLCASVRTLPRNHSTLVTPDAVRAPGMLIEIHTDIAHCWFAWIEGALHGQFHDVDSAVQFLSA
jgi:hypothetical protein